MVLRLSERLCRETTIRCFPPIFRGLRVSAWDLAGVAVADWEAAWVSE